MTFRSDLDALRARHDVLETEVATRQAELTETRRMIEEVEQRARLPVLDNIRVAAPCTADWTKMAGDERVRACGDCNKNVYNLSSMTREEAEALIIEKEGRLCVRYYRRTDGTILLGDCTIGVSRRRRRKLVAGAAALLAATGVVAYGASRGADTKLAEVAEVLAVDSALTAAKEAEEAAKAAKEAAEKLSKLLEDTEKLELVMGIVATPPFTEEDETGNLGASDAVEPGE